MQPTTYDKYILYLNRWLTDHFNKQQLKKARRMWREDNSQTQDKLPFLDWVAKFGIYGMAPACYAEWLSNEYAEGID